jgi:hypothetical protein
VFFFIHISLTFGVCPDIVNNKICVSVNHIIKKIRKLVYILNYIFIGSMTSETHMLYMLIWKSLESLCCIVLYVLSSWELMLYCFVCTEFLRVYVVLFCMYWVLESMLYCFVCTEFLRVYVVLFCMYWVLESMLYCFVCTEFK